MEGDQSKHARKFSWRGRNLRKDSNSKSSTLPAGAVLMDEPSGGFFSKIRRSFKFRSKGKFSLRRANKPPAASEENLATVHRSSSDCRGTDDTDLAKVSCKSVASKPEICKEADLITKQNTCLPEINSGSSASVKGGMVETLVTSADVSKPQSEQASVENGVPLESKDSIHTEEIIQDIDPDYETLDNIRRKLRSQFHGGTGTAPTDGTNSQTSTSTKSALHVMIKPNTDLNEPDSGLGSPFTESIQESQTHSISSATFDTADGSVPSKDKPADACSPSPDGEPEVSSQGYPGLASEDDDLYSNSKIVITKQHQKQSHASVQFHDDHPQSANTSHAAADLLAARKTETPSLDTPPPLPARNYSVDYGPSLWDSADSHEANSHADLELKETIFNNDMDRPSNNTNVQLSEGLASGEFNSGGNSHSCQCAQSVCIEQGPTITMTSKSKEDISQGNTHYHKLSQTEMLLPDTQHTLMPCTTDSCEATKEGFNCKLHISKESYLLQEADLPFIDEDPSCDNEWLLKGTDNGQPHSSEVNIGGVSFALAVQAENVAVDDLIVQTENTDSEDVGQVQTQISAPEMVAEVLSRLECVEAIKNAEHFEIQQTCRGLNDQNFHQTTGKTESEQNTVTKETISTDISSLSSGSVTCKQNGLNCPRSQNGTVPQQDSQQNTESIDKETSDNHSVENSPTSEHSSLPSTPSASVLLPSSPDTLNDRDNMLDSDNVEEVDSSPQLRPQHVEEANGHGHDWSVNTGSEDLEEPPPLPARKLASFRIRSVAVEAASSRRSALLDEILLRDHRNHDQVDRTKKNQRHRSAVDVSQAHKDFIKSMKQLKECGWYWGPLSSDEAVSKLSDKRDGSFLVRDSTSERYILSISFKNNGRVHHTRIEYHKGLFSFWEKPDEHSKAHICQFIQQTVEQSRQGHHIDFIRPAGPPAAASIPIQFLYPVSRFCRVASLQHMCRFVTLQHVRRDRISDLPLPQKVKDYLLETQYYVETLEED